MSVSVVVRRRVAFLMPEISPDRERCVKFPRLPVLVVALRAPDAPRCRAAERRGTGHVRALRRERRRCYRLGIALHAWACRSAAAANLPGWASLFLRRPW